MEPEDKIKEQFDRAAGAYSTSPIFAKGHDLKLMVEAAKPAPDMTVLDVGCAAGHTAFAFAPHVQEVIGVDISQGMLAEASQQADARNITNVHFQEAIASSLPFADQQFDIVTCRYVAHHFPSLMPAITEIYRVLKAGGQFLVVDIISPEEPELAAFINQVELLRDPSHSRDWMISEWQAAGEEIGMPLNAIAQWDLPIDFADWTARQQTPPDAITQLETLLDSASPAVQSAFSIVKKPQRSFHLWSVLLQGTK
ncbi:class I SAM-dependent methyltransferase [Microcoleus sp. FACHB-672]|uniref:class I SAM-dependent methyltransferase n=1 Tax=Microcoleus sp. FACHB-672 TaxID=2692825 RepID=UPI001688C7A3|nr:methyltransferase domain-containing protein [Microcoleus sp. FACHB-672]MBD2043952.1 methyltransferase domain-containing protein [Microcoleus sp. FACHB-672]